MKATVGSLVPYEVRDSKPGVIPYEFIIPPSNGIIPATLVVDNASSPIYRGSEMPPFPLLIPGEDLAKSIVEDYCRAQIFYSEDAHPALFWVVGEYIKGSDLILKFPAEVEKAKKVQLNWYDKLFKAAEDEWARNHQHKAITDIQRFAASALGKTNVEWYTSPEPVPMIKCPACMTLIEAGAIVCKNCKHIINPAKAKELSFAG